MEAGLVVMTYKDEHNGFHEQNAIQRRGQWQVHFPEAQCTKKKQGRREDRKSTRLNSSHSGESRMPSSA